MTFLDFEKPIQDLDAELTKLKDVAVKSKVDLKDKIKELAKATIRCIPLNNQLENGKCILTGKDSRQRVLFARAY